MPKRKQEELAQQVQRKRTSGQGGGDRVPERDETTSSLTAKATSSLSPGENIFSNPDCMLVTHVPLTVKEKIWSNQYVELQTLLKKEPGLDSAV